MISPEAGDLWFRAVLFILICSLCLLFVVQPGTAEFVVTVVTLVIALVMLTVLYVVVRRSNK